MGETSIKQRLSRPQLRKIRCPEMARALTPGRAIMR
jgi:hypothetical protein